MEIVTLDAAQTHAAVPELVALLQNVVDDGASVGYIAPMAEDEAAAYWQGVARAIEGGDRVLFVARDAGRIAGTVQLYLERRPNGSHRGEVNKLLVHTGARRKGIAKALMIALEQAALEAQRSLLVLDTIVDGVAEGLYLRMGYTRAGIIPDYALSSGGVFEPTSYMYKLLDRDPTA